MAFLLSGALARSPRVRAITFLPCNCHIYCMEFGQYWTSFCYASSSAPIQPYMQFLFVSSGFCLRLPSDSTSRWTPLPLANSSYYQACSGLSPPSYRPCRAHIENGTAKELSRFYLIINVCLLNFYFSIQFAEKFYS